MSTEHDGTTDEEQTEADHDGETPVNHVRVSRSGRRLIIDECVVCGEQHSHGSMDPTVANGGRSHRSSHCPNSGLDGGYYIKLAPDAERPDHWLSWLDRESGCEVEQ